MDTEWREALVHVHVWVDQPRRNNPVLYVNDPLGLGVGDVGGNPSDLAVLHRDVHDAVELLRRVYDFPVFE